MNATLVNYNFTPEWLSEYPSLETTIYDRSDDGVERNLPQYGRTIKTPNRGDVDYDKLTYLVENYDTLPDVFLWGKTNIFKFVDEEAFKKALNQATFTPLLKQDHRTYSDALGTVCYYLDGLYHERADSWFFNAPGVYHKYFQSWEEWCFHFGIPRVRYIPFPPGGNFILTKEKIHKYSRDFYDEMRSFLPHCERPAEAQCCERSYYLIWR